jgi:hypothetical protein
LKAEKDKYTPSGCVKALEELLDLPQLDLLVGYVLVHFGQKKLALQ